MSKKVKPSSGPYIERMLGKVKSIEPRAAAFPLDLDFSEGIVCRFPPLPKGFLDEPCAMCLGAVTWSGVKSLVCGARGEDAEAVGFDEGPKVATWWQELEKRHIGVTRDVLREDAAAILSLYAQNGHIYNARQG